MPSQKVQSIIEKLSKNAALTAEDLEELQTRVDTVEARSMESHHETTSHHHTSTVRSPADLQQLVRGARRPQ